MAHAQTEALVHSAGQDIVGSLNSDMFGAIAVNNYGWNYFEEHIDDLGMTNIRFPGGTVAEAGYTIDGRIRLKDDAAPVRDNDNYDHRLHNAFDLTHPELINPKALQYDDENHLRRDDVATFSQVLAKAVETDASVSVVIPLERYYIYQDFSDPVVREKGISAAVSDISVFLQRLKDGEYNNGDYPEPLVFDLGNELYKNPIEAALLAKAMSDVIVEELEGTGISYEIGFHMSRGAKDYNPLISRGYFEKFFNSDHEVIPELENIDFIPNDELPYEQRVTAVDQIIRAIFDDSLSNFTNPRHHTLGFTADALIDDAAGLREREIVVDFWENEFAEIGIDREDINYDMSAFATSTANGNSLPYELAGAANLLEIYDYMIDMGVDRASIWGVVGSFKYKDDMGTTTVTDRLSDFDSPHAAMLKLMTGNVKESDYLGSGGSDEDGYRSFTYETETAYTTFLYVKDVMDASFTIDVDLGLLGDLEAVNVVNLDIVDGAANGATQLTETELDVNDGKVRIGFDQDFEVAMITLTKSESEVYSKSEMIYAATGAAVAFEAMPTDFIGLIDADEIIGSRYSDIIVGLEGSDVLDGGSGRGGFLGQGLAEGDFSATGRNNGDAIFGGGGDDVLLGHAGNDLLSGGEGDDDMWGGSGFDTFIFNEGNDQIHDFSPNTDRIILDQLLADSNSDFSSWLNDNAVIHDDSITLDFGSGNRLTVNGVDSYNDLVDRVSFSSIDELSLI